MIDDTTDFDSLFPDFDPSSFTDRYPSPDDFPSTHWEMAMRRVYDHELYKMARDPANAIAIRRLARRAWAEIERGAEDAFVCDLAGQLFDCAVGRNDGICLQPLIVAMYLNLMLCTGFRQAGASRWAQHVLHEAISFIDVESQTLSVEQAFAAGWAAGRADGEFEDHCKSMS